MFKESLFNSDRYQYTMGKIFTKAGKDKEKAIFDVFFRKAPDGNGWAVVSGITEVLELIKIINSNEYTTVEKYEMFFKLLNDKEYATQLSTLKFTGNIYTMREGEIAFPNEPIITLEAPLLEAQILETPILSIINHQMAVATKASRVTRAAKGIPVSSFGSRRAHGPWASIYGDKAAFIGGCDSISNIMTENKFGIPSIGTMAHSFIEAYGSTREGELKAFKDFVKYNSGNSNILLIDTYDVLKCGLPHAIQVFKEFELQKRYEETGQVYGIRLDSGDLAYLSKKCRQALLEEDLRDARIMVTNGLDEYLIKDLFDQEAEVDGFGVGDAIATSKHNPCFGGVYKLAEINNEPVMKLSEDTIKIINPGFKQVYRIYKNNEPKADLIALREDNINTILKNNESFTIRDEYDRFKQTTFKKDSYNIKELLIKTVENGEIKGQFNIPIARQYYDYNISTFSIEHTRLTNPHIYKVDISDDLYDLKINTIKQLRG